MDKTRYLQISPSMMLEYRATESDSASDKADEMSFYFTSLRDSHLSVFSPVSYEYARNADGTYSRYDADASVVTLNTFNHQAFPADSAGSQWYTFLDQSDRYVDGTYDLLLPGNEKVDACSKYCSAPFAGSQSVLYRYDATDTAETLHWDVIRMYFVAGYDFSESFAASVRACVTRKDGGMLDLCDVFYTKAVIYKYVKFLDRPVVFGNVIYDRYVDFTVPSVYDLKAADFAATPLGGLFSVSGKTNVHVQVSLVGDGDWTASAVEYDVSDSRLYASDGYAPCVTYSRTATLSGAIPLGRLTSDSLGAHIAEDPDCPYLDFYGTWKDLPLDTATVQSFNKTVALYDTSLIRKDGSAYEVDSDYSAALSFRQWLAVHEITCKILKSGTVIKEEAYTMSQTFNHFADGTAGWAEDTRFHYRPAIFDGSAMLEADGMEIEYVMRFVNVDDNVQFIKKASLGISSGLARYWARSVSVDLSSLTPYRGYNRLETVGNTVGSGRSSVQKVKYVKCFYDSTTVALDSDGTPVQSGSYVLTVSQSPKNYKFVFRRKDAAGNWKNMDLSDGYYKLYGKDASNSDISIDATYSSNMNVLQGELEFKLTSTAIARLTNVPEASRKLSVVVVNDDGSVSTLYAFGYAF